VLAPVENYLPDAEPVAMEGARAAVS